MARQSLTPYGGADPILSLHREMNRLFDDVFRGGGGQRSFAPALGGGSTAMFNAQMDVSETDKDLRVCVDLPGVSEQDIDVSLDDDILTIRGEKKVEQERGDKENYHFVERSYGSFQRALRLPFNANPEEVRASFENGVLTVTVPKTAQQARSRRIEVQGAGPRAIGRQPGEGGEAGEKGQPQAGAGAQQAGQPKDQGGEARAH
jgi:HSP20 family protein